MAAGTGGDPAAERRILKTLREMPQRQPVRFQLTLEVGAQGAALDQRRPGDGIDLAHAVEMAQIDGDRAVARRGVFDAAADARSAAERRQQGADVAGEIHRRCDLRLGAGISDQVGATPKSPSIART